MSNNAYRSPRAKPGTWNREVEQFTSGQKAERLEAQDVKRAKQGKGSSAASRLYMDSPMAKAHNYKSDKATAKLMQKQKAKSQRGSGGVKTIGKDNQFRVIKHGTQFKVK